ncbi:2-oxo acid dehydrogenase subunit E2 [Spiroplasma endosymbiont of Panorpa germanica]|uniref:2-oxo acid dehydrogenase subunit E2 n=1 Tax=Spiroplasma endosymbiont of Panorpa germanica TaxID=3066314 RepID=UPI0030CDCB3A
MNRIKFKTESNLKGIVEKVYVLDGEIVKKGQVIAKISTQLETFDVVAHVNGVIKNINILESLIVTNGDIIFDIFNEQEVKNIHSVKSIGKSLKDVITENPKYNQPKYDSRDQDIYENAQTMTMEIADQESGSITIETVNMQVRPSAPLETKVREIVLEEQLSNNWTDEILNTQTAEINRKKFDELTTNFDNLTQELDIIGNMIDKRLEDESIFMNNDETIFDGKNFNVPASTLMSNIDNTDKVEFDTDKSMESITADDLKTITNETMDFDLLYEKTQVLDNSLTSTMAQAAFEEIMADEIVVEEEPIVEEPEPIVEESLVIEEPIVEPEPTTEESLVIEETPIIVEPIVEESLVIEETPIIVEPIVEESLVIEEKLVNDEPIEFLTWDQLKMNLFEETPAKTSNEEVKVPVNENRYNHKNISEIKKQLSRELAEVDEFKSNTQRNDLKSNIDLTIKEFDFLSKDYPKKTIPENVSKKDKLVKKTKASNSFGANNFASNTSIDLEVDLTSLSNLFDLMAHPFFEKGLELSLMTFFIKAAMKSWNKTLQKNGLNIKEEDKIIRYSLFSKKEMVLPTISISLNEEISEIARILTEQKQEFQFGNDYPENSKCQISIIDFGSLKLKKGIWQLKPGELFAIGVGNIIQKPVSENNAIFIKNMVNITMTFNNKTLNLVEANQILQEFAKLLINPGLLI